MYLKKAFSFAVLSFLSVACGNLSTVGSVDPNAQTSKPLSDEAFETEVAGMIRGSDVVANGAMACGKSNQGEWYCWGPNQNGTHGLAVPLGASSKPSLPVMGLPGKADELVLGKRHACALVGQKAYCWGALNTKVSGISHPYPVRIEGTYLQLTAGDDFTCGIQPAGPTNAAGAGRVACWGSNAFGQLGKGDYATDNDPTKPFVAVGDLYFPTDRELHTVVRVVAGSRHVCAVREEYSSRPAALYCWGANDLGQLGIGDETVEKVNVPTRVVFPNDTFGNQTEVAITGVTLSKRHSNLAANGNRTCMVPRNMNVYCWGDNTDGTLGFEHPDLKKVLYRPTHNNRWFVNGAYPQHISMGKRHMCSVSYVNVKDVCDLNMKGAPDLNQGPFARPTCEEQVKTDIGGIRCWGDPTLGRLGPIPTDLTVVQDSHCRSQEGTNGLCFIQNGYAGNLGASTGATVTSLSAGDDFNCLTVAKKDGNATKTDVLCFGNNNQGQLARGFAEGYSDQAASVLFPAKALNATVTSMGLGTTTSCASLSNGELRCFGDNSNGLLGLKNSVAYTLVPTMSVANLRVTEAARPGRQHQCVAAQDGNVYCWGANNRGQLGRMPSAKSSIPQPVVGLPARAVEVVNGTDYSCARLEQGDVWCWGQNAQGQLGRGNTRSIEFKPGVVPNLSNVKQLASGTATTCALATQASGEDAVFCWGSSADGATAKANPSVPTTEPVRIAGVDLPKQIAGAGSRFCAATLFGEVFCWGANPRGNLLGTPVSNVPVVAPTQVVLSQMVAEVSVGLDNVCARTEENAMYCWGDGASMQLRQSRLLVSPPVQMFMDRQGKVPLMVSRISAGNGACAVTTEGQLACWGEQSLGRLGTGDIQNFIGPFPRQNSELVGVNPMLIGENREPALVEMLESVAVDFTQRTSLDEVPGDDEK